MMTRQPTFQLATPVRKYAQQSPDAPAISFGDTTLTWAQLDRRSSQVANALIGAGVEPGDRVAVLARNCHQFFELVFGASKAGAVLAGLNWRLAAAEVTAIVRDAAPTVVVVADEQRPLLSADALATPGLGTVISLDTQYEAWIAAADPVDPEVVVEPNEVTLLLYTSGTTGVPKGVELTNANMAFSQRLSEEVWGFTGESVNLVGMPMFHIGGVGYGMSAIISGGHTVVLRDLDTPTIISAITKHRVTHAFFVPAVVQTIISFPEIEQHDLSSLQLLCYGASPIGDAVLRRAIQVFGCQFTQAYGMTETAGTIVALPPIDHAPDDPTKATLLRACGRALPWVELQIVNPATRAAVGVGEVGEIWVRTPMNMRGYRNKADETASTLTGEGWLRTGDAAYADADGYIFLFDRYKDMIVSGAENIYPAEIENVLYAHPSIAEVAVIGVPHPRWGETPKAVVVFRPGMTAAQDELIEFTRQSLARYKCPTSVDVVETIARNASGKVLKKELRAPFWVGHDRSIS
jgi:acyl-CoA synthetase (AMP-forming)/AMP-acid ligase II